MFIGKTIKGRYRIYDQLGVGGSAAVFLARDTGTGRIVVVKIIHSHLIENRFVARFVREIKVLQQASSKHIVEIYDYGLNHSQDDLPMTVSFIAMEYVEGLTLASIIERLGVLTENNTLALGMQIAEALSVLHKVNVVHRDLKSQNIMITADNIAKIIDFGVAKNTTEQTITGTDIFAGTLSYASPEQLVDSRAVDIRSDLYSLGVVMAECLIGKVPPRSRKGQHLYLANQRADATVPSRRRRDEPATNIGEVVQSLLSHDPQDRYPTPEALLTEMQRVGASQPLSLPWDALGVRATAIATIEETGIPFPQGCYLVTDSGENYPLRRKEIIIGRSAPTDDTWMPEIDVRKMEKAKTVSRFHCRIFVGEDGSYWIMDMGSFNGTWVNGRRLESKEAIPLKPDDRFSVGAIVFTFNQNQSVKVEVQ
jgi:serine/threonine-protein kinase